MGVYRAMFLVDVFVLSFGVGIIFVAMLSWERSGIRWLRDLAFVLAGATTLLMADLFRIYAHTSGWPAVSTERAVLAVLTGIGNLVLVISVPLFTRGIAPTPLSRLRRVMGTIGMILFPLAGIVDELVDAAAAHIVNDIGMASLLAAAVVVLGIGYRRIAEPETRRLISRLTWVTVGTIVLGRAQLVVTGLLGVAPELRRVRIEQIAYYLAVLVVVLVYAVKHLFRPSGATDVLPTEEFLQRHDISNRERDIIAMIVQGHANRVIGERLFISDRTVKNHISSIYRKTGAVNKVQLLNMVRNNAGSQGSSPRSGSASADGRAASAGR